VTSLTGFAWLESFDLPSGHRAVVSVPLGATEPRPIVVGVHGAGDRAEWACGGYRIATGAYPFVVCPEGNPAGAGKFSTAGSVALAADIDAAVRLTREKFGRWVADGPLLYAGFSLGAIHAVPLLAKQGSTFPRVLLLEGAFHEWTPALARSFVESGGERVMLVCAGSDCSGSFGAAKRDLERAGAAVEIVGAGTGRHNLDGPMMKVLASHWAWLVEGDARWARWRAAEVLP
jgi:predicted esterase